MRELQNLTIIFRLVICCKKLKGSLRPPCCLPSSQPVNIFPVLRLRGGGADQIEYSIERTNQEIIEWIETLSTEKISIQKWQIEASKYFGFEWNRKTFFTWNDKFLMEIKKKKMEVTYIIMEEMGGTKGKQYKDIPPKDFFPCETSLSRTEADCSETCNECNFNFTTLEELKQHVRKTHQEVVKKIFRKEAGKKVASHDIYISWLQKVIYIDLSKHKVSNPR